MSCDGAYGLKWYSRMSKLTQCRGDLGAETVEVTLKGIVRSGVCVFARGNS